MIMETETEKFFHMTGDVGDSSYAQNSGPQKRGIMVVKPLLQQIVSTMRIGDCKTFRIADLGCSSGPNTLLATETIVKAIQKKHANQDYSIPEVQVFLSDLPLNDFNSVFRHLPPVRSYFAAAVPGSFYGRLFPHQTLHFVHSSYSLHWLSQVPAEVRDENSEAWNKGNIFISKDGPPAVSQAYARQFRKDFNAFLRARSQEMVPGGRMFLSLGGRRSSDMTVPPLSFLPFPTLERILDEMVSEGLIAQEKVDSFNVPMYFPCPQEMRNEVGAEGSFTIQCLEVFDVTVTEKEIKEGYVTKEAYARMCTKHLRALSESMVAYHFGGEVMDKLYEKYEHTFMEKINRKEQIGNTHIIIVLVLERLG